MTSSNYDDKQQRTTGGRNGYGAKLANLFSTSFIVDTASVAHNKRYIQEWSDNMSTKSTPKITKYSKTKGYTTVRFIPDLKRFGLTTISNDLMKIIERRVYDCCACTPDNVKVSFNGVTLSIKTFDKFMSLFPIDKKVQQSDHHWDIGVSISERGFKQISFVNGIQTTNGGSHVDYIVSQLIRKIGDYIQAKHKSIKIRPNQIKDYLFLFVKCTIVNPSFSSQTKTELTSRYKDFGSRFEITDETIQKICKLGFLTELVSIAKHKELQELNKSDGRKQNVIRGIPKLEDATKAGTRKQQVYFDSDRRRFSKNIRNQRTWSDWQELLWCLSLEG